ncbi:MAG: cyclic peptide export ABC transporter [Luteibacter sp.]
MVLDVIKRSKARIVLASAISVLAGAANIWLLSMVSRDVHDPAPGTSAVLQFSGALALMVSVSFISQITLSRLSAQMLYQLRNKLVRGITHLSAQKTEAIGRHRLYAALTRDVPSVHDLLIALPNYVFNLTVVIACLAYLATVSHRLFGVFSAFLVIGLCIAKFAIADRAERRFQIRRKVENELFRCYEAVIDGNKELKLNSERESQFVGGELNEYAESYRKSTMAAEFFWNVSNNWATAVIFVGVGALMFLAPHIGMQERLPVTTFVLIIFYMVGPLTILMNSFRTIHAATIGLKHLNELHLDTSSDQPVEPSKSETFRSMSSHGVVFHYESVDDGLPGFSVGPLDLTIDRGEIVYFVGGNGSGKTTAAKILTGLYTKDAGTLLINGIEVDDQRRYFHYFSAIFQDYYLFDDLVAKHGGDIDMPEVQAWLARLRLSEKVSIDDGRLSTTKLSYGQRKRLALLIAFVERSEIYVFDEWAADQDQEFREFFYCEFLPELKRLGRTAIVVTHDERYFHLADKVVKFEGGKIVDIAHNSLPKTEPNVFVAVAGD